MAYFTDVRARTIIHDAYAHVVRASRAVAEGIYSAEELHRLPDAAVELALGVGHPVRHARLRPGEGGVHSIVIPSRPHGGTGEIAIMTILGV